MNTKKRIALLAALSLLLAGSAMAQGSQGKKARRVSNRVMQEAKVNLQTGVITRGATIQQKAAGASTTAASVNNLDFAGFIGIDSGDNGINGPCEWFSSVHKGTGNTGGLSTYLASFTFAYCTIARDVKSGGPGAIVTFNFWDGFTNGNGTTAGNQGTNIGSVTITGLPAGTDQITWCVGGFALCTPALITADVSGGMPISLPDSNIAVSYRFDGLDSKCTFSSGPILGLTATFLSCVQSCSAAPLVGPGPRDNTGMNDYIDNYCGGSFVTSFSFVTGTFFSASFTSINFQLNEFVPLDASDSIAANNGPTNCNSSILCGVLAPFIGGGAWIQNVECGSIAGSLTVGFSSFVPIDPITCGSSSTGEFLVNPTLGRVHLLTSIGFRSGSNVDLTLATAVPLDLSLIGSVVYSQAYCAGNGGVPSGETRLSNRLSTCIGTQE